MKGQTEAVTAIMITGVVVGAVASAYVWGAPLVDKRQSQAELENVESNVMSLEEEIRSVSNGGEGTTANISLKLDEGKIEINESVNYIDINYFSTNTTYSTESWQLLKGEEKQGLSFGGGNYAFDGEDRSGIVAATQDAGSSAITYRVEFRNMRATTPSGEILYQTDLQPSGAREANGDVEIFISNEGTESEEYTLESGETIRRKTVLRVDKR
jgi:hypothetical protein